MWKSHTCPELPTDVQWYIGNPKLYCRSVPNNGDTSGLYYSSQYPISHRLQGSSHLIVPWEGLDRLELCQSVPFPTANRVHPIPLYHGRDWTERGCTKVSPLCCALYLRSIPSHCTMGETGRTGVVPKCPLCYALYLVSIPSHCTMGLDGQWLYQSVPFAMPCTYCPSHPIVPWDRMDGQGLYQSVPFAMPCTYCPSHPIVPNQKLLGEHARDPPSFPHTLSTDTYLPPINPSNLILPALGQKAERNSEG